MTDAPPQCFIVRCRYPIGHAHRCKPRAGPAIIRPSQRPSRNHAMHNQKPAICFIGFGEAGQAIASGLREAGVKTMSAWDILFPQREGEKLRQAAETIGVRRSGSAAEAVRGADMIISAVTAASSVEAARSVKPHLA